MTDQRTEQLVKMANQIAINVGEHRNLEAAVDRTREHLEKFWTPDMRKTLSDYAESGGIGLSPAVIRVFQEHKQRCHR